MNGIPLSTALRWMTEAAYRPWYDYTYTMHRYLSGDTDAVSSVGQQKIRGSAWSTHADLIPEYPSIDPAVGPDGFANHGAVNARINAQGLTMEPEIVVAHDDPVVREYIAAYFRTRWEEGRWGDHFYAAAMEVEAGGVAFVEAGLDEGRLAARHSPVLDTLWDRSNRMPSKWGWYAMRDRLTPERAKDIYGDAVSKADIEALTHPEHMEGGRVNGSNNAMDLVTEWRFFTGDDHFACLGAAKENGKSIFMALDDDNVYRKIRSGGRIGPNPFGVLTVAPWVDSWLPSQDRPAGKASTTIRIVAMLNEVERYMIMTLRNGIPLTAADGTRMDRGLSEQIRKAKNLSDLSGILVTKGGSIKDVLSRLDPAVLPNTVVILRAALKEELNASTGTMDMMRGQALSGERTKAEIDSLNNHAGIQGQHFRRQFARFVEDFLYKGRAVAAQYDRSETRLTLPTFGRIDSTMMPVRLFLEEPFRMQVTPGSLVYKTERDRQMEAIQFLNTILMPGIQAGVLDPRKSFEWVLKQYGLRGIEDFLPDPAPAGGLMMGQAAGMPPMPGAMPGGQPAGAMASLGAA